MTLSIADYGVLASIFAVPLGIVGLYLRTIRCDYAKFQKAMEARLGEQQKKLEGQETRLREVELRKVSHDDWVQAVAAQGHRLEKINDVVREMAGKVEAALGTGTALNRLAAALEKKLVEPN